MTQMAGAASDSQITETSSNQEPIYYCEKHGIMNKLVDLKEKVDQIARRA